MYYKTFLEPSTADNSLSRTVVGRISSTTVDRQGDVMLPGGMDYGDYMKNAVVLFMHDKTRPPVARTVDIRRTSDDVFARVKFADRPQHHPAMAEWMPDTLYDLYLQGMMKGFSVGFTVPAGGERAANVKEAQTWPGVRRVIARWKLVELSVVSVPANPDALALAANKGLLEEGSWLWSQLRMAEQLRDYEMPPLALDALPPLELESAESSILEL